jgi:PAS domain S-box-containing protein
MADQPLCIQSAKGNILRRIFVALRWLIEPSATIEKEHRQRARLLSVYFLFLIINILLGVIFIRYTGNIVWIFMSATAIFMVIGYVLSRTGPYWTATMLAVTCPAFPTITTLLFTNDQMNVEATLMWLVLPLLISTLILSLGRTVIIAVSYVILVIVLAFVVDLPAMNLGQSLSFITSVTFLAIAIALIRKRDQSETEHQLNNLQRAEEALRESEEKYSSLVEHGNDGIVILQDGLIKYANSKMVQMLGYSLEETMNKPFINYVSPGHRELVIDRYRKRIAGEEVPETYELDIIAKDGKTVNVEVNASLLEYQGTMADIAIVRDITERKRVDKALRESEEKFSKGFYSSPDIMSLVNLENNKFIEANDNFTRYTGYTRDEVIGHTATELGIWANPEERDRILNIMNKEGRASNEEFHLRTKSGEIRLALLSSEQILIGGESCSIAVVIDITESKAAEEKLKQTLAELKSSSAQLAATNKELEAFSYSVSHDLRSPLRSIDGFSQALLEDYENKLDKNGKDYLQRLRGASQKMGELIDGILKLSRLTRSEMHKEKINLSALAEEITARLQEDQPERDADFVISKGLIDRGDPQLLRALFENLLGNAWKFTSKREKTRIEFGITKNGGEKTYFINDNGAGFDMTYADKLFGAFQRLHEVSEFPGTGIGLATVQRIINRHGGSIWAEGVVEKGATFYFTLN